MYTWLIAVTYFLITSVLDTIPEQQKTTTIRYNSWKLQNYTIDGKKYIPDKKKKNDVTFLIENSILISKYAGKKERGTYFLNTKGTSILMTATNGEITKEHNLSISNKSLTLKYDIP